MNITKFETQASMTLKEITDLLEVRHNDAMKTVAKMAESPEFGELRKIRSSYTNNIGAELQLETYALNKRQSIAVAARLNTALMMRIIDRWQELEEQVGKPQLPQTYLQALEALVESEKQKEVALLKIEQDKPKVVFAEAVETSFNSISVGAFSKVLGIKGLGRNKLFSWFRDNGYLMQSNIPYQQYIDQSLFEVRESVVDKGEDKMVSLQTLVTGKGQTYFTNKISE